ncbi:MAG: multidrug effflux MFS transporter [Rhodospirillales bacterium]|nr:multidrug effflux MFS transporter [Rhodospirillales bacterium]
MRPTVDPESLIVGALLTALVALGQISTSIYIPSMPAIVEALATTPDRVNLTLTGFLLGFAACQMVFGPLSDRCGRRPTLFAGLGLYAASSMVCWLATDIRWLIVGRVLQGMAACVGPVLGRAIVRDIYGPTRTASAMAYIGAALAVSPAVAPIIGGYLQIWFGWRAAFVFLAVIGVIIFAATWWLLAETRPRGATGEDGADTVLDILVTCAVLIRDRHYLGYTLIVACIFSGLMAFAAGGPFVFIGLLGLSPEHYGMLAIFTVAGYFTGSLIAGRLARSLALPRLVLLGTTVCLVGAAAMSALAAFAPLSVVAVVAPMAVFTAGLGVVLPSGIAAAMAPFPRIAGAASALLGFVQMLIAAAASFAVGALPHASALSMAAVITAGAVGAMLAFIALVRPTGPKPR